VGVYFLQSVDVAVLSGAVTAAATLVLLAGNKLKLPGGVALKGRAEKILLKTGRKAAGSDLSRSVLKKKITQANLTIDPDYFTGIRYALPAASVIVLGLPALAGLIDIYWAFIAAAALYLAPNMWLNGKVRARVSAIKADIPEFCILLGNALRGADMLISLEEVSRAMKGELSLEINRVLVDMATGDSRAAALNKMARRCDIPELTSLMGKIQQAMRYGSPLEPVVKRHAEKITARRKHDVQKIAGELSIKLLFPIILFILLPMFIMLGFPVFWSMLKVFG